VDVFFTLENLLTTDNCETVRHPVIGTATFRGSPVDRYHAASDQLLRATPMNKKVQKQLEAAKKKLQNVQQQLAGARKQPDDPADIPRLEKEVADLLAEIHKLKAEA
jgi:hypothetical protein